MTTDLVRAGITEKRPFYIQPKRGFWPKMHFYPKKQPKFLKRLIFIWEKATFFFEQLFPVVARTWLEYRSIWVFLSPKPLFFAKKIRFLPYDPNFGQRPVRSPRRDRSFSSLEVGPIFLLSVF